MTIRQTSIIICSYNRADRLPTAVGYLRAQDYPQDDYEIIVVDNNSTDHTREVVERLAGEPGATVRYVSEPRQGVTYARNTGAEAARFPYLTYIDDDCSVAPDWLQHLMSGFDLDARVQVAGGVVVIAWEAPRPAWFVDELKPWLADTRFLGATQRILNDDERLVEANTATTKQAWTEAGGFLGMEQFGSRHMAAGELLYLLEQVRRSGGKVAFTPAAVVHHHVLPPDRNRLLRRAYWQGISDHVMDYLLNKPAWAASAASALLDLAAFGVFLLLAAAAYLAGNGGKGFYQLTRAAGRTGMILCKLHLVGDWQRITAWTPE